MCAIPRTFPLRLNIRSSAPDSASYSLTEFPDPVAHSVPAMFVWMRTLLTTESWRQLASDTRVRSGSAISVWIHVLYTLNRNAYCQLPCIFLFGGETCVSSLYLPSIEQAKSLSMSPSVLMELIAAGYSITARISSLFAILRFFDVICFNPSKSQT